MNTENEGVTVMEKSAEKIIKKCFVCKTVLYSDLDNLLDPGASKKALTIWSCCDKHKEGLYAPGHPDWVTESETDVEE